MERSRAADFGLLVLRFSGLFLALFHGLGKVQGLMAGERGFIMGVASMGLPAPEVFAWASALTECVGGLLIFIGLGTRLFAAIAVINMGVAAFLRHRAIDQWLSMSGLVPMAPERREQLGNPELATLYLICFLTLVFTGAGSFSIDAFIRRYRD